MTSRRLLALLLLSLGLLAPAAQADDGYRPDFDARSGDRAAVPQATRAARDRIEDRLGDEGTVATQAGTGGVRVLARTDGTLTPAAPRGDRDEIALDYVRDHPAVFGLDDGDIAGLREAARYTDVNGITHITWEQTSRGIASYDTNLSVNLARDGAILNVTGGAVPDLHIASADPAISASAALGIAQRDVGAAMRAPRASAPDGLEQKVTFVGDDTAKLVIYTMPDGDRLAWELSVQGQDPYYYDVVVDATTGELLARHSLTSFAANASVWDYHPGTAGTPGTGTAASVTPHTVNLRANPNWLPQGFTNTTTGGPYDQRLWGVNVWAYADVNANNFDDGGGEDVAATPGPGGDWIFPQASVPCAAGLTSIYTGICTWAGTPGDRSTEITNRKQTTTQLFYFDNVYHDWLATSSIGFTNASHNFEYFGTGGSDPVFAEADDASGFNNANMSTGPDGTVPLMQMYLFTNPAVNSGDDASVVYHEYTHGLTNRLINNGLGNGLNAKQSRAMGEGWSDFFALDFLAQQGHVVDTAADGEMLEGEYVTNNPNVGIRNNAIDCSVGSANGTHCPGTPTAGAGGFTFGDLGRIQTLLADAPGFPAPEVHADGELWAETLWDLRKTIGAADARRLVAEGVRLSPVNPSMLDARDGILVADANAGGTYHDQIWAVFANRGMGLGATTNGANATRGVPSTVTPSTAAQAQTPIVTDPAAGLGDGDNVPEPGETVKLQIPLRNLTGTPLNAGTATLTSSTPGVVVGEPTVAYGTINGERTATPSATFAISIPTTVACATHVALTLQVGAVSSPIDLPLGNRAGTVYNATSLHSDINDLSVRDLSDPDATIHIDTSKVVDTLHVHLKVAHGYIGDLQARLFSPSGREVSLLDRPGANDTGSAGDNLDVLLDDAATVRIQDRPTADGTATTGSFSPNQPLAGFRGDQLAGDWKLLLSDTQGGAPGGTLQEVYLEDADPVCSTAAALADVTTTPASDLTGTSATLNGTVDPNGTATDSAFEYGTTTSYGTRTAAASAGSGSSPTPVSAGVTGLTPGATYHYRALTLRSGTVTGQGGDMTFIAAPAPTATTTAATNVTATGATLNGTVNPNGVATDYRFEYGTTVGYGTNSAPASAGNGSSPVAESLALTGLTTGQTYHYRIVALRGGTVLATGGDQQFTPSAPTAVGWRGARVTRTHGRAIITWRAGARSGVVGYSVVRVRRGVSRRITSLIPGGALATRTRFRVVDRHARPRDRYRVREHLLSGAVIAHRVRVP